MRMFDTESILSENDSSQSSSKTDSDTSKTSTSKEDKQPLLTPKDFKNRLLQLGFKISDITTEGTLNIQKIENVVNDALY